MKSSQVSVMSPVIGRSQTALRKETGITWQRRLYFASLSIFFFNYYYWKKKFL